MYDISVEIGNVKITGPLGEVAKFLAGAKKARRVKVKAKNGAGRPKKKRSYKKKNAEYWATKGK